ncbi:MAG TPA: GNAT family N-acetyltransferase [Roseiflexaceae bacterium]|nr:GNAT family N-acetyltransferase [Roseiflexaceae bacterium]
MTDLNYRAIPEADLEQYIRADIKSFTQTPQEARDWLAQPRERELRALYRGDQIVTQMTIFPLKVSTGAAELPFSGLAGAATPPEERRQGHVARLLREVCDELLAQGTPLCMLYPFKTSFYGQYGWATFAERKLYSGAPHLFSPFRNQRQGRWEQVGHEAIPMLDQMYRKALRGRFGPFVRSEGWWRTDVFNGNPAVERFAYVWRDEQGSPRAYLLYRLGESGDANTMICRETVALDPTARAQIFAFLAQHEGQVEAVSFRAPADAPINLLMPNPLKCEVELGCMLRLLDVATVLSSYGYPPDARGRLTIAVADTWLAHNQGVFELEVGEGVAQCRRLPDGAKADLSCDVGVLAQIIARYVRPHTAAAFGLLAADSHSALTVAEMFFAGLAPFASDAF